ncbi:MAG: hypothetical protein EXR71_10900 [Myxococcales bacterium]|nr:hypothetical protein [Myxococcales bacterium]
MTWIDPSPSPLEAAGRLVIPVAIRRERALCGGAQLAVDVSGGTIHLRPTATAALAVRGRRLVVRSALTAPVPDHPEFARASLWLDAADRGDTSVVWATHAYAETWSVLSRLPLAKRLEPHTDAWQFATTPRAAR